MTKAELLKRLEELRVDAHAFRVSAFGDRAPTNEAVDADLNAGLALVQYIDDPDIDAAFRETQEQ